MHVWITAAWFMDGGGRKISSSIIDLPSLLSRGKQMKRIGQNRFHLGWERESSFHARGRREGQTRPATCLSGTDRSAINQFVAMEWSTGGVDRSSSASVYSRPYILMFQTADWTKHTGRDVFTVWGAGFYYLTNVKSRAVKINTFIKIH